jgi:hypothetical protein
MTIRNKRFFLKINHRKLETMGKNYFISNKNLKKNSLNILTFVLNAKIFYATRLLCYKKFWSVIYEFLL